MKDEQQQVQSPEQMAAAMATLSGDKLPPNTQQQAAPPKEEGKSDHDKATEKGAPVTEGDLSAEDAILYKVKFGDDDERELTPQQISKTFERYAQQQSVTQYMAPVLKLASTLMKQNPGMTPQHLVQSYIEMANKSNKQMGGEDARPNTEKAPAKSAEEISAEFEQWEKDNAASLPPGYKDMMTTNTNINNQMQQMMQMMQQVITRSQGMTDASKAVANNAQQQTVNATKQRIANNINAVQQKLGMSDEHAGDFKMFAAERGYTMEDFIDPMLTFRVAQDFKNSIDSGEMARLKDVHQRRQAFTQSIDSQPVSSGGAAPVEDKNLEAMIDRKLG